MRVLVTGASGFIGKRLVAALLERKFNVVLSARSEAAKNIFPHFLPSFVTGELRGDTDWRKALTGVDTVVHLAALVHAMKDTRTSNVEDYKRVNTAATEQLAQTAIKMGVRRFVYVSSIKVNGEYTVGDFRFTEEDKPNPQDAYASSKWEAEKVLRAMGQTNLIETVIIRPPLVYGGDAKANFKKLVQLIKKGVPLPLGAIKNSRSLIYVDNLADLIVECILSDRAANQTYLASDGYDLSTPQLIQQIAYALNKPAYLLPVPLSILNYASAFFGKQMMMNRLTSSLKIDVSKIEGQLNWRPPYSVQQALQREFLSND